jgi:hypothetical protein
MRRMENLAKSSLERRKAPSKYSPWNKQDQYREDALTTGEEAQAAQIDRRILDRARDGNRDARRK